VFLTGCLIFDVQGRGLCRNEPAQVKRERDCASSYL
jgi:hypothetical protein